eukprot:4778417-Pyramimonas_sp.AAC.1
MGGVLGGSGGSRRPRGLWKPPAPALGPILGLLWGDLGLCWAPLQQSGSLLGPSWGRPAGLLGGLGPVLGGSSALLD